ncbi:hypothetical protein QR98_0032210 [Sarcoptes scabiei]|uniref:Uncharacterized protein n=1 Tax=Sarcoptes scabiei TaxID=52283 RepID=A0A132A1C3_SARSC|nr:hypothetical protein QR98_0032210 [Sarcoptes scabiei]
MVLETERYFSKLFVVGGDDHKGDDDYDDNAYERKKIQPIFRFIFVTVCFFSRCFALLVLLFGN